MKISNLLYKVLSSLHFYFFTFTVYIFTFSFSIAQEINVINSDSLKRESVSSVNNTQANQDKIEFKNETGNSIIIFTDEGGNTGSITLNSVTPFKTTNKLYNESGILKFNGNAIGNGGANSIDELSDAKHDGTNLFIGEFSGSTYNGGSNSNTAIGYESMKNITTGGGNTAIGNVSLKANNTGFQNTGIGNSSLISNTTGNRNVAIGVSALYANTTGKQNTVIGTLADAKNQGGTNNTIIGFEAGKGISTHNKSGNVFLGYQAGFNETGDNKLYIENSSNSSPLIWGDFTTDSAVINGNFHVTGNITTDGANLGITKIDELTDAKYDGTNLFVGFGSGINSDLTTSNNTGLGKEALKNIIGGDWNVSIGYQSMYNNTTGFSNLATGAQALYSNTTGQYNTANGASALYLNTTGQNNVANGFHALYSNTIGQNNVGIGRNTNYYNEEGNRNTIIGHNAGSGSSLHNKSGNVFLGFQAGFAELSNDKLYIENSNSTTPLIWGDFASDLAAINGKFGVNTQNPTARVDIVATSGEDPFRVAIGGATKLKVHDNGGTSIGLNASGTPVNGLYVHGDLEYNAGLTSVSDKRYKTNIKSLNNTLENISKIRGVTYDWKRNEYPERNFSDKKQIGVIAQEVEEVFPELVSTNEAGYKSVDYVKLTPILLEAVKELEKQNSELEKRMIKIESFLDKQRFSKK
jgi:hypothetical protein